MIRFSTWVKARSYPSRRTRDGTSSGRPASSCSSRFTREDAERAPKETHPQAAGHRGALLYIGFPLGLENHAKRLSVFSMRRIENPFALTVTRTALSFMLLRYVGRLYG